MVWESTALHDAVIQAILLLAQQPGDPIAAERYPLRGLPSLLEKRDVLRCGA